MRGFSFIIKGFCSVASNQNASKPTLISSAEIKVERAYKHILELSDLLAAFLESHNGRIAHEFDRNADTQYIRLDVLDPPSEIPYIVGDIAHNLRSALDHVAGEIRASGGGKPEDGYFPISDNRVGTEKSVAKNIRPFNANVARVILENVDCSDARNAPIWGIKEINNIDKHRRTVLTVTRVGAVARGVRVGGLYIKNLVVKQNPRESMISAPISTKVTTEEDFSPTLSVTFGEPAAFNGQSVIPTLTNSAEAVSHAIRICRTALHE